MLMILVMIMMIIDVLMDSLIIELSRCYWLTAKDYGLFLADEDPKKGIWLEPGRNLGYYMLRSGVNNQPIII